MTDLHDELRAAFYAGVDAGDRGFGDQPEELDAELRVHLKLRAMNAAKTRQETAQYETGTANFLGHEPRPCTEHRTVGPHRARCFDCNEWCSENVPCEGCAQPEGGQS